MITLKTVNDFKRLVGENDFFVTFRKANGQFRRAEASMIKGRELVKGALDEDVKEARNDEGIVSYFDLVKNAFRSFKLVRMTRLEVNGQVYQFGF